MTKWNPKCYIFWRCIFCNGFDQKQNYSGLQIEYLAVMHLLKLGGVLHFSEESMVFGFVLFFGGIHKGLWMGGRR